MSHIIDAETAKEKILSALAREGDPTVKRKRVRIYLISALTFLLILMSYLLLVRQIYSLATLSNDIRNLRARFGDKVSKARIEAQSSLEMFKNEIERNKNKIENPPLSDIK